MTDVSFMHKFIYSDLQAIISVQLYSYQTLFKIQVLLLVFSVDVSSALALQSRWLHCTTFSHILQLYFWNSRSCDEKEWCMLGKVGSSDVASNNIFSCQMGELSSTLDQ